MKKQIKHLGIEDVEELRRYWDVVDRRIWDYRQKYENYKHTLKHALEVIHNMTQRQLTLGVAVISAVEVDAANTLRMPIETYCKSIQHQAGKPFVCMSERENSPTPKWSLFVPRLKDEGMENLVAPLLLIGTPKEPLKYDPYRDPSPKNPYFDAGIHYETNKQGWVIWFVGEENEEMRLHWLEMCRTESVFRLCLRMPALPVDVSVYGL